MRECVRACVHGSVVNCRKRRGGAGGCGGVECANWNSEQEAADLFSFVRLNMKLAALSRHLRSPVAFDFEMTSVRRLGSEVRR